MKGLTRRPFTDEDKEEMRLCAERLKAEPDPDKRLGIQLSFVRKMEKIHGHERATHMLTDVWTIAKKGNRNAIPRRKVQRKQILQDRQDEG